MNQSNTDSIRFFNTQIQLYRLGKQLPKNSSRSVSFRLKQLKEQVKQLDDTYKKVLTSKVRTQKSISNSNKNAQKIRVDFLKLYQNKKIKLLNRQKLQNHKLESQQVLHMTKRKTKQRKMIDMQQLNSVRNEEIQMNQILQQRNKREKQKIQKQIKLKSMEHYRFAKSQYNKIRQDKISVAKRNQKIAQILDMRSQINYVQKIQKQLNLINWYEDMLKQVQGNSEMFEQIRPATSASKSFFVTSKKICTSQRSTRGGTRAASRQN